MQGSQTATETAGESNGCFLLAQRLLLPAQRLLALTTSSNLSSDGLENKGAEKEGVESADTSLLLDAQGLSRGHFYVNGHDLGRYYMIHSCANASHCPLQFSQRFNYIPREVLLPASSGKLNALVVIDELRAHGLPALVSSKMVPPSPGKTCVNGGKMQDWSRQPLLKSDDVHLPVMSIGWFDNRANFLNCEPDGGIGLDYSSLTQVTSNGCGSSAKNNWSIGCARLNFTTLQQLCAKTTAANVKLTVGLDFVGACKNVSLCPVLTSPAVQSAYVALVVAFVKQHQLDGVEVDYEAFGVGSAADKAARKLFTALLVTVNAALTQASSSNGGGGNIVGVCLGANFNNPFIFVENTTAAFKAIDYYNVMSYTWSASGDFTAAQKAVAAVEAVGFPKARINLGVAFYGKGGDDYCSLAKNSNASCSDPAPGANSCNGVLVDGVAMQTAMGAWVVRHGFGGVLIFQVNYDKDNLLLKALGKGLKQGKLLLKSDSVDVPPELAWLHSELPQHCYVEVHAETWNASATPPQWQSACPNTQPFRSTVDAEHRGIYWHKDDLADYYGEVWEYDDDAIFIRMETFPKFPPPFEPAAQPWDARPGKFRLFSQNGQARPGGQGRVLAPRNRSAAGTSWSHRGSFNTALCSNYASFDAGRCTAFQSGFLDSKVFVTQPAGPFDTHFGR